MEFVDIDAARDAPGLRLLVLAGVPSPWSQAAVAIVEHKRIEALVVRRGPRDDEATAWTGVPNAPAALYDAEPARSGWVEILMLAERLAPLPSLVPADGAQRAMMFGLSHALMGEDGVVWNSRLWGVHTSLASGGERGYPIPVAKYLGARYGYREGCAATARARMTQGLATLGAQLEPGRGPDTPYYFVSGLTALDFYSTAVVDVLAPLDPQECPMHPVARAGFESVAAEIVGELPTSMLEHRDMMHARHVPLPLRL